ncbi:VWA domain-containing protein [Parvibaculaceae bacterium PLY_AMNH_Bact1]|nr:VWA domain-containing protein [Parvibaculaceae bacterium PLY_AMNH_Bact1]
MTDSPGHIAENIAHFARVLRRAGVPVGPRQVIDAIEAVQMAGITSESDLYWALHTTLIHSQDMRDIFNQAFHVFWRDPRMLERMMAMMLPELATLPEEPEERTSRRLAEALLSQESTPLQDPEPDIEIDARETMSAAEILRTKDFEQMSAAEIADARKALSQLHLRHDSVLTRRTRPSSSGALIDMRSSLRASLRGGDIIPLKRRERRHRPPPLVVLCDISGSMSVYARTFLHFLHALTNDRDRVHTFLFGTRLTHVSRQLRHKDIDEALSAVSNTVEDWDGGTRVGETLRRFNVDWARRVLGQGATVLLVTDGLDRDGAEGLEPEIARLHRASRRLIWLNPLLRYDAFEPKALGIRTMLPHVDEFRPVHNLASLQHLVASLSAPNRIWPTAA